MKIYLEYAKWLLLKYPKSFNVDISIGKYTINMKIFIYIFVNLYFCSHYMKSFHGLNALVSLDLFIRLHVFNRLNLYNYKGKIFNQQLTVKHADQYNLF